jgi:catechol 2,3-dioxygenase-like lactoylglutathione lyase family enzyme
MRKRPAIPRIDGGAQTVLLVADVERTVEFYGGKLLLERRDGDAGRYAEYDTGEGGTLVIVRQDGSIAPMASPSATDRAATLTFTIGPDGYETWKKWFAQKGVAIERETKWIHGGRSLFVRDPDGRRIEFKTPPAAEVPKPVVLQERKPAD